jgi:hypothetical protein
MAEMQLAPMNFLKPDTPLLPFRGGRADARPLAPY